MKYGLACLLILTLVFPAEARERTPLEQAKKIKLGSRVVVYLKNNQIAEGRLGEPTGDRFTLQPFVAGDLDRVVLFQDVQKITRIKEHSAAINVANNVIGYILLVIELPLFLLYCAISNHDCLGWGP